jgi:thymidylate kinase
LECGSFLAEELGSGDNWVIADRSNCVSGVVYGLATGFSLFSILPIIHRSLQICPSLRPDLVICLDIPVEVYHRRRGTGEKDRIENAGDLFVQKVIDTYRWYVETNNNYLVTGGCYDICRIDKIDGTGIESAVFTKITQMLSQWFSMK